MISRTRHQTCGQTVRGSWLTSCEAPSKVPARAGATVSARDDDTSLAPASCQPGKVPTQTAMPESQGSDARTSELHGRRRSAPNDGSTAATRARSERSPRFRPSFLWNVTESAAGLRNGKGTSPEQTCCDVLSDHPPACFSMINAHLSTLEHQACVEK